MRGWKTPCKHVSVSESVKISKNPFFRAQKLLCYQSNAVFEMYKKKMLEVFHNTNILSQFFSSSVSEVMDSKEF